MNGIIILDKPPGMTSHDAVETVRKLVRPAKVGHAGTLDPQATGILILLLGKATKVSRFMMGLEKEYDFTMELGVETDTLDRWGKKLRTIPTVPKSRQEIAAAASRFLGRRLQVVPSVSAVKHKGVRLYRLARTGGDVPRKVRQIEIKEFEIVDVDHPLITARVVCSSGTYVRALARDMGETLGSVASVSSLRRTRVGRFGVKDAITLDEVVSADPGLGRHVIPLYDALDHLPRLRIGKQGVDRLRTGRPPRPEDALTSLPEARGDYVLLVGPGREAVAIARWAGGPDGYLTTERVL
jgi:tRNA pseudouridine55 synthase